MLVDIREIKTGDLLRELRDERGLTQDDLANLLNIKRQTYSAWERNISNPDISTIDFLADYYDVSTDYLLGRTNIKSPTDKIASAIEDDKELSAFWDELKYREDLQLLFKQSKELSPKAIQQIIRIIKAIEDEEDRENE